MHPKKLTILAIPLVFMSCKPEAKKLVPIEAAKNYTSNEATTSSRLNGSIFIVKRNGESMKLGLVNVQLISEDAISHHLAVKAPEVREARLQMKADKKKEIKEALGNIEDQFKAETERVKEAIEQLEAQMSLATGLERYKIKDQIGRLNRITVTPETMERSRTHIALSRSLDKIDSLPLEHFDEDNSERTIGCYFNDLPPALDGTLTDADGRFVLKLPRIGQFAVFAKSSREIGDKMETYYWLIRVSADGNDSKQLLLSNNNLVKEAALAPFFSKPPAK